MKLLLGSDARIRQFWRIYCICPPQRPPGCLNQNEKKLFDRAA